MSSTEVRNLSRCYVKTEGAWNRNNLLWKKRECCSKLRKRKNYTRNKNYVTYPKKN